MKHGLLERALPLLALTALAPLSRADLLVGTVVDAQGNPVAGVDLDAKNLGSGGNPDVFNDGTAADGTFAMTIPAGTFRITFNPPPPPLSNALLHEVEPVVVSGTTNMGTIVLPAGVALTGRLLGPTLAPVAGVNFDAIDSAGNNVDLLHDNSDAAGYFAMAIPPDTVEVRMDTTPVVGGTLAPEVVHLTPAGDVDLGDFALEPGFVVTAIVRGPGSVPVANVDVDAKDTSTGLTRYTPGDNSNSTGFVDFVVAAGTYDFMFCPPSGQLLAAAEARGVSVTGSTTLGIVNLAAGRIVQGTVRTAGGAPVAGVDIDAHVVGTGADVPLCTDTTNAAGGYSILVPNGTYDLFFDPPYSVPSALGVRANVTVTGTTTVSPNLPDCPFYANAGTGTPGTGGAVPQLAASGGAPRTGNSGYALEVTNGRGGARAVVIHSLPRTPLPFASRPGATSANPTAYSLSTTEQASMLLLSGPRGVAGAGAASIPLALPDDPGLVGATFTARVRVYDPSAVGGRAESDLLVATVLE